MDHSFCWWGANLTSLEVSRSTTLLRCNSSIIFPPWLPLFYYVKEFMFNQTTKMSQYGGAVSKYVSGLYRRWFDSWITMKFTFSKSFVLAEEKKKMWGKWLLWPCFHSQNSSSWYWFWMEYISDLRVSFCNRWWQKISMVYDTRHFLSVSFEAA